MTREAVTSDQLPASGLPFSVAVRGGGLLFLSGQVAHDAVILMTAHLRGSA